MLKTYMYILRIYVYIYYPTSLALSCNINEYNTGLESLLQSKSYISCEIELSKP